VDLIAVATGFLLGLQHCLAPDHVAAVAQFASADPRPRRGMIFGLAWGAGHGAAVLGVSLLVYSLDFGLDARFAGIGELAVGVMLIGLGAWRLWSILSHRHEHPHRHDDGQVHSHAHAHTLDHAHVHGSTATGFLHGLAGAAAVLALVPLSAAPQSGLSLAAAFVAGSLLGMGTFGALASLLFSNSRRFEGGLRIASLAGALAAVGIGIAWIARHA
jgi:ABC-type nickel/cobalt efflux system permease component RcnA